MQARATELTTNFGQRGGVPCSSTTRSVRHVDGPLMPEAPSKRPARAPAMWGTNVQKLCDRFPHARHATGLGQRARKKGTLGASPFPPIPVRRSCGHDRDTIRPSRDRKTELRRASATPTTTKQNSTESERHRAGWRGNDCKVSVAQAPFGRAEQGCLSGRKIEGVDPRRRAERTALNVE
jgi:hypothetical protein